MLPPPPPVALNQESVPDDFICSICMTLPAEPLITRCDHIFCRTCIHQALDNQKLCPIDRRPCNNHQLEPLKGALLRIWSGIQVKCGYHENGCAWRGSIADYKSHTENCSVRRNPSANNNNLSDVMEELETLRRANAGLLETLEQQNEEIDELRDQRVEITYSVAMEASRMAVQETLDQTRSEMEQLRQERDARPNLPRIFHGSYHFRREHVVELSQLISRYLEDKPNNINSNRIFNCVRSCYTALDRDYCDNSDTYYEDMRMLLATCLASNWFSDNQYNNILEWNRKHFTGYG